VRCSFTYLLVHVLSGSDFAFIHLLSRSSSRCPSTRRQSDTHSVFCKAHVKDNLLFEFICINKRRSLQKASQELTRSTGRKDSAHGSRCGDDKWKACFLLSRQQVNHLLELKFFNICVDALEILHAPITLNIKRKNVWFIVHVVVLFSRSLQYNTILFYIIYKTGRLKRYR